MPRVIGIDPGTVSVDVCGLDEGRLFLDRSLPTSEALADGSASASDVGSDRSRKRRPSSSPQTSTLTVPGSIPITRGIAATPQVSARLQSSVPGPSCFVRPRSSVPGARRYLLASRHQEIASDLGDRLRVEHEIVVSKEAGDAGLVDLHLQLP